MLPFALLLAVVWSGLVAAFIEWTDVGRWISVRMTWFIVAVGVGGDLLILLLLADAAGAVLWWHVVAIIAVSSVPVSLRGIIESHRYYRGLMDGAGDAAGE